MWEVRWCCGEDYEPSYHYIVNTRTGRIHSFKSCDRERVQSMCDILNCHERQDRRERAAKFVKVPREKLEEFRRFFETEEAYEQWLAELPKKPTSK